MYSKNAVVALSSVAVFACSWLYFFRSFVPTTIRHNASSSLTSRGFHAPKENVWADLDNAEFDDLLDFLFTRSAALNLSRGTETTG